VHRAVWCPGATGRDAPAGLSCDAGPDRYLDAEIEIAEGEEILTEMCCKFNEPALRAIYASGLELIEWHTDSESDSPSLWHDWPTAGDCRC